MDPNATLIQIITHINDGESAKANVLADALCDWFDGGGFCPSADNKKTYLAAISAWEDADHCSRASAPFPGRWALDGLHTKFYRELHAC
jgi:hypothetical protein